MFMKTTTKTEALLAGTRIYYTGDMANASGIGQVDKIDGNYCDMHLDDGRAFRLVPICAFQPSPGRRFMTLAEHKAQHEAGIAQMKARIVEMQVARAGKVVA